MSVENKMCLPVYELDVTEAFLQDGSIETLFMELPEATLFKEK